MFRGFESDRHIGCITERRRSWFFDLESCEDIAQVGDLVIVISDRLCLGSNGPWLFLSQKLKQIIYLTQDLDEVRMRLVLFLTSVLAGSNAYQSAHACRPSMTWAIRSMIAGGTLDNEAVAMTRAKASSSRVLTMVTLFCFL